MRSGIDGSGLSILSGNGYSANRWHMPGGKCSISAWKSWAGSDVLLNWTEWRAHGMDAGTAGQCGL